MPTFGRSDAPYDAVIVGAGIAGCATALELHATGWRVAVVERGDPAPGAESVPKEVVGQLAALGVETGSPCSTITAWWGSERAVEVPVAGARIVDRAAVARALRERLRGVGITLIDSKRCEFSGQPWAWVIQIMATDGVSVRLCSRYLVDATGRASIVGRHCGARREDADELIGVSFRVSLRLGRAGVWTECVPEGWWNLCCSAEHGTLSFFSTAAVIREVRKDIASLFLGTRHLREFAAPPVGQGWVRDCSSSRLVPCAGEGWLAVGDAAITFQPLGSAGVGKALRDARLAHRAFEKGTEQYVNRLQGEFEEYMNLLGGQYIYERRWPERSFWEKQPRTLVLGLVQEGGGHTGAQVARGAPSELVYRERDHVLWCRRGNE